MCDTDAILDEFLSGLLVQKVLSEIRLFIVGADLFSPILILAR